MLRIVLYSLLWVNTFFILAQSPQQNAQKQALEVGDAMVKKDYRFVLERTYPKVVELGGGMENMLKIVLGEMEKLESEDSITVSKVEVGLPQKIYKTKTEWFCIVPKTTTYDTPTITMKSNVCLVGISADKGCNWSFVDCTGVNANTKPLIFTTFPKKMKVPGEDYPSVDFK